jgi:hypothetical protein
VILGERIDGAKNQSFSKKEKDIRFNPALPTGIS